MANVAALGVPVEVVARFNYFNKTGNSDGTVLRKGSRKVETIGENRRHGETFNLGFVFGDEESSGVRDLYARSVQPLLAYAFDGYSIAVMSAGATGAGKSFALEGSGSRADGVVHLAVSDLINGLKEKSSKRNDGSTATFSFQVKYVEVFDENITDLFNVSNTGVHLKDVPDIGVDFHGATSVGFSTARDFVKAYDAASQERLSKRKNDPDSSRRAWSALICDITQEATYPRQQQPQLLRSRAVFVDMPGDETLSEDPSSLIKVDGPLANKSIFAFGNLVEKLSDGDVTETLNHDQSVITSTLYDAMGGNCVSLYIANINPISAESSSRSLRLAQQIGAIKNYPIPNDNQTQGLLRRYRSELMQLKVAIEMVRNNQDLGTADGDYKDHLLDMQGAIVRLDRDKGYLRKNEDHLATLLQEMKVKYREAVERKAELQAQLIASEEDRLLVSKTLIDVQIENTQLREESETGKFELVNKLLNAENDLLHLEVRLQEANKKNNELMETIKLSDSGQKDLTQEFVTLKANYVAAAQEHEALVDRNEELQLEIVNLLNFKETVSKERDALLRAESDKDQRLSLLQSQVDTLQNDRELMQDEIVRYRTEVTQLREQASENRKNYETALVQGKGPSGEVNDRMLELSREKDQEILALKREVAHLSQAASIAQQNVAQQKSIVAMTNDQDKKRLQDTSRELAELRMAEQRLRVENDTLQQKMSVMGMEFRDKLHDVLRRIQKAAQDVSSPGDVTKHIQQVQDDIVRAYSSRDTTLCELLDNQRRTAMDLAFKYRRLQGAYRNIRSLIDEYRPAASPLPRVVEESDAALEDGDTQVTAANVANDSEINRLRHQIATLDSRIMTLQDAERHAARLEQELQKAAKTGRPLTGHEATLRQVDELQRQLEDARRQLKSQMHRNASSGDETMVLRERNAELQRQVTDLTTKLAASAGKAAAATTGATGAAPKGNFKSKYAKELKDKLRWKSQAMELDEQNQLLTAELNKREERAQQKIMELKQQLSHAGGAGVPGSPYHAVDHIRGMSPADRELSGRRTRSAGRVNPTNLNPVESWRSPGRDSHRRSGGGTRPSSHYG